jgi:UMF1 family MFS transporter
METILANKNSSIRQIVAWAFYDFAISAYFVVIYTFVFATYFSDKIAPNVITGTALWSYTISASGLLIALLSPFLGAIADYSGQHKRWLFFFTYLAVVTIALLWFAYPNGNSITLVLSCIFLSNFALEVATVFYNSFLIKLAPANYLGRISGWAWGCGYLGGLLCLILSLYFLVDASSSDWISHDDYANIRAVPLLVALWLMLFSLPLFFVVKQKNNKQLSFKKSITIGIEQLVITLKGLTTQKDLLLFIIARILYIDGLNTLLALGGIYAAGSFKLSLSEVMLFGIIINITAGIGATLFALFDDWIGSKKTILIALFCLICTYCFLLTVTSSTLFWLCAPIIGVFVGPIQAASRTFLARLTKPEEITRMFGFYAFSGKATSFIGPLVVGIATSYSNSQRVGMALLIPFFIIGGALLLLVDERVAQKC